MTCASQLFCQQSRAAAQIQYAQTLRIQYAK